MIARTLAMAMLAGIVALAMPAPAAAEPLTAELFSFRVPTIFDDAEAHLHIRDDADGRMRTVTVVRDSDGQHLGQFVETLPMPDATLQARRDAALAGAAPLSYDTAVSGAFPILAIGGEPVLVQAGCLATVVVDDGGARVVAARDPWQEPVSGAIDELSYTSAFFPYTTPQTKLVMNARGRLVVSSGFPSRFKPEDILRAGFESYGVGRFTWRAATSYAATITFPLR